MSDSPVAVLYDATGLALAVVDGAAIGATEALVIAGKDGSTVRFVRVAADGTVRVDPTGATTQPVSLVTLPLPSGAALAALQTQPGVDIGDVTVNNSPGAAAVNIQDGGNSLTVDAAAWPLPTGAATEATLLTRLSQAGFDARINTLGQKVMGSSMPVAIASDQTVIPVSDNGNSITVDASSWPLPAGASTAALQTQPGVDIGDVTVNNAGGVAAVNIQDGGNSITVDGTVGISGTVPVSGPLTNTDPRALPVPFTAASLPLPTGAATAALQTQPGVDIGDVTINNATGAAAVNIQDGGNSITVDGPLTDAQLRALAVPVSLVAGGGANQADRSVFADGSGQFNPIGGVLNDTPISPTEDQAAAARITPNRALHVNLRNQAGVEFGTSGNPLITASPGSAAANAGFNFGDITTAALTEVAVRRTAYTEQASDAQRSISSASANDTAAGTGARTVRITYLTSAGAGPFTEVVTLNGVAAVATVATNICFIESMEVTTVGSGGTNAGVITLFVNNAGGGGSIGTIGASGRQTFWCHHYVPAGLTASISAQWAGHTGTTVGSGATFVIRSRAIGVANAVEIQISDSFRLYGQSSSIQRNYGTPIEVTGPARILTYVTPETASSTNYRASFDFFEQ